MTDAATEAPTQFELRFLLTQGAFKLEADLAIAARAVALFGPSGSGKTTILEVIAGLRSPQHDQARLILNKQQTAHRRVNDFYSQGPQPDSQKRKRKSCAVGSRSGPSGSLLPALIRRVRLAVRLGLSAVASAKADRPAPGILTSTNARQHAFRSQPDSRSCRPPRPAA